MKALKIIVTGKVQGVFFRASTKEVADQLGIKGYAQNLPDGSVQIEAAGDTEVLNEFVDWCKHGPPRAEVIKTEVHESTLQHYLDFQIRR